MTISLALVAVSVIVTLLLANIKAGFLVLLVILMIDIELLGLIYWWGLTINVVTISIIVISVGLAVDYNAHIVHSWLTVQPKITKTKITIAVDQIGVSVLHGGISTFLAILILPFGKSYIF